MLSGLPVPVGGDAESHAGMGQLGKGIRCKLGTAVSWLAGSVAYSLWTAFVSYAVSI